MGIGMMSANQDRNSHHKLFSNYSGSSNSQQKTAGQVFLSPALLNNIKV